MDADGIFSGGGIKGLAFAGALQATEEAGYDNWKNIAGTSAGAIVAMTLAVGYNSTGLKDILLNEDFSKIADFGHFGPISKGLNLIRRKGLTKGEGLHNWIKDLLQAAPEGSKTQFGELTRNLKVIGTDLAHSRMVIFPDDVELYADKNGKPFDMGEFPIADAVRISAGFPYFFPPLTSLYDRQTGQPGMFVDGGVTSQLPVFLFDVPNPARPTWGFNLFDGFDPILANVEKISGIAWPYDMAKAILNSSINSLDFFELKHFGNRIIAIPTGNVPTLNFSLTKTQKNFLWQSGYETSQEFFSGVQARRGMNRFGVLPRG